jgi:hypothetical protein
MNGTQLFLAVGMPTHERPVSGDAPRFGDLKDTWRAERHRVEEVLDARLKHLKER